MRGAGESRLLECFDGCGFSGSWPRWSGRGRSPWPLSRRRIGAEKLLNLTIPGPDWAPFAVAGVVGIW